MLPLYARRRVTARTYGFWYHNRHCDCVTANRGFCPGGPRRSGQGRRRGGNEPRPRCTAQCESYSAGDLSDAPTQLVAVVVGSPWLDAADLHRHARCRSIHIVPCLRSLWPPCCAYWRQTPTPRTLMCGRDAAENPALRGAHWRGRVRLRRRRSGHLCCGKARRVGRWRLPGWPAGWGPSCPFRQRPSAAGSVHVVRVAPGGGC
jgi:hypothetical protein